MISKSKLASVAAVDIALPGVDCPSKRPRLWFAERHAQDFIRLGPDAAVEIKINLR